MQQYRAGNVQFHWCRDKGLSLVAEYTDNSRVSCPVINYKSRQKQAQFEHFAFLGGAEMPLQKKTSQL